ncbi:MAG TPA: hypothetical protein VEB66_01040 [Opitutaceae bacterium]|nr:hypothetical protein [Opitutaceae bacterium]
MPRKPIPLLRRLARWALPVALGLQAGCNKHYTLQVESVHHPQTGVDLDAKSYVVTSIMDTSSIPGGKLHKQEVAKIVAEALAVRGMYQAPSVERSDVVIEISYGMGPHKIEVSELTNPARGHTRTLVAEELREKHLTITARVPRPGKDGQPPEIVWTVDVRTRDDNEAQLRKYLPILAEVAATWASRNTHGTRSFTATLEDGVLIYVSGGYEQPGVEHLPE